MKNLSLSNTPLIHNKHYNIYYGSVPIILNFPHSGRLYPKENLKFITEQTQSLRIFEDPYLDILLPNIEKNNTSFLINHCARAFIDVNRGLQKKSMCPMINGEAMGLIPLSFPCGNPLYTHGLHEYEIQSRIDTYYKPYHKTLNDLIVYKKQLFNEIILLDCHSMPSHGDKSDPDAFKARPDIIIGDNFGTSASEKIVGFIEQSFLNMGLSVFRNFPYAGGHIIQHYGSKNTTIHAIQIEINRNLYIDTKTFKLTKNAYIIAQKFQSMVQKLKEHFFD